MARIVILDDNAVDRRLLVNLAEHAGHEALETGSGLEALTAIRAAPVDLVVTDVLMPEMDGYAFVRRLRADEHAHQPRVIFYTATYLLDEARTLAEACGVSDLLVKPAEPEAILAAIDRVLEEPPHGKAVSDAEFDRTHLRVVNEKLFEKVSQLEALTLERRRLLADVVGAQEAERRRIAAEIHDDSIQVMAAAGLRLDLLGRRLADGEDREAMQKLGDAVGQAVGRLRRLTFELRPQSLDTGQLPAAIAAYLTESQIGENGPLWHVDDRLETPVGEQNAVIFYRIAQEALRNARKHAGASALQVMLERTRSGVQLTVRDDGGGCDVGRALSYSPGHLGLVAMRERAEIAGGWMRFESVEGAGSSVTAWLPEEDVDRHAVTSGIAVGAR
jgi:signal transduction histidine kinase